MFRFVVKHLNFLKHIPLLAWIFDGFLKVYTQLNSPQVLQVIDEVETELENWPGISTKMHRYGGIEFGFRGKELGHIHSNGLADVLLNLDIKNRFIAEGICTDHHIFGKSGWVSFYIRSAKDKAKVLQLFEAAYALQRQRLK